MSSNKLDTSTKKLKQACLPFKLVNSPSEDANSKCRKRKLSGCENEETQVENSKVELLNGGTKCFIKSDENKTKSHSEEINEDVNIKIDTTEFVSEKSTEKADIEKINVDTSNICENNEDVDDKNDISSNSDVAILVDSIPIKVKLDNNSSVSVPKTPTPKRIFKKQESAKKQEERLRLKQEKEKEKERIREEKLKEQIEKQRLIEQKRLAEIEAKRLRELEKEREKKQKEEEKKAKELEKEKERKQREEEKKAKELEKEKERKQKEEERKAKELEKEKQKEEKLLKEEIEKKKKEKIKAAFIGFFKQKSFDLDTSKKDCEIIDQEPYFMPFQTKQDMKIAPSCRKHLNNDKKMFLDKCINQCEDCEDILYLSLLKTGKYEPSKSERTWPVYIEEDDDVIIIETGSKNVEDKKNIDICKKKEFCKFHWKLLQFNENKRPPYWGTWRKKSLYIKPRKPFACDKIMFDYEVDSDDEWEEEDPGESIHGTDNEEEPEDDYEVDNDVFVPHGYLSDEEGDQDIDNSKEAQKEKLKLLGEQFEAEIKKKTQRIKPILVGCIWIPNNVNNPENVSKPVADTLLKYRCIWDDEEPILTEEPIINSPNDLSASENNKILLLPDSIMPDLIKFIHANNTSSIKTVAKSFINELEKNGQYTDSNTISLHSVRKTIKHIATKSTQFAPWYVSKENFEKYDLEYPKDVEIEVTKSTKSTVKKITSFMTPQSQKKVNLLEKSCGEIEQKIVDHEKINFIPKKLFDVKDNLKPQTKEKQKINFVDGKKRITPIFLSPKKKIKLLSNDEPNENSGSPEIKITCEETSINTDETI